MATKYFVRDKRAKRITLTGEHSSGLGVSITLALEGRYFTPSDSLLDKYGADIFAKVQAGDLVPVNEP